MSYTVFRVFFLGGAILAAVFLVISVILFFVLKIPKVFGYLTGATRRKGVESIRQQSEENDGKVKSSLPFIGDSGKLGTGSRQTASLGGAPRVHTITPAPAPVPAPAPSEPASETSILAPSAAGVGETSILSQSASGAGGAAVYAGVAAQDVTAPSDGIYAIEYEITFIHTDEVIA